MQQLEHGSNSCVALRICGTIFRGQRRLGIHDLSEPHLRVVVIECGFKSQE